MRLFDIQGNKVLIHPDTWGIPMFRKLWESTKDKSLATDYLSYIVFKNKYNSPYVEGFSEADREPHLKLLLFNDKDYILPEEVILAEKEYVRITETLFIGLLKNARDRLDSISKYYKDSLSNELNDDLIKTIIMSMEKLGNVAKSLESLEEKARKEEAFNVSTTVRGGGQIGAFEMRGSAA